MTATIPLDEQIVATLTDACTSDQAAAVLADAARELKELTAQADAADVSSLSPLASAAEARALRQKAGDHRFEADRMEASVSALEVRVAELRSDEEGARRRAAYQAVLTRRNELAKDIAAEYPEIVRNLTSLAKRITESDAECERVGIRESAEAIGRGIPANFYRNSCPLTRIMSRAIPTVDGMRLSWDADTIGGGWQWRGLGEQSSG